ncbi:MAG: hypothetical protein PHV59_09450 [Victivallales bacterium]|nr:hypothetical protein [Victivallales bacterium]
MSIFERIKLELNKEYKNSNQEKLAQKASLSQVTIGRYLSNIENIRAMRLDTFFALFPDADIIFHKPVDTPLDDRLHSFIDKLSAEDKEKIWNVISAIFSEHINEK